MRILIGDADDATAAGIACTLKALGYETVTCGDGGLILKTLLHEPFDLVILDRILPTIDGLTILQTARQRDIQAPIFLLTALGEVEDRLKGLHAGADDYIVKPFAMAELSARIAGAMRRLAADRSVTRLTVGPLTLDLVRKTVRFRDKPVILQPREINILEELMRRPGKIVTRAWLFETIWNLNLDPQTNVVESHISRLRAKLAIAGAKTWIETVRGAGYRLRTDVAA